MMKETLFTKLIKHTFGIAGELDEHRKQIIGDVSTKIVIILFYFLMIESVITLILLSFKDIDTTSLLWAILGTNFLATMVMSGYIWHRIEKTHLADLDVERKDYETALKQAKKISLIKGIQCTILFPILLTLFNIGDPNFNFFNELFTIKNLCSGLFYGFFMWIFIRYMSISHIKKESEN